ncbi:MAG: RagB/SusD family nutrient uptake outer membrane protein, partial [Gemmatimonadota bacterium]
EAALYTGATLGVFGEHFCEMTIDAGPLMTPTQTLDLALEWIGRAQTHFAQTGDYALTVDQGTITPSVRQMALGLSARIKWSKGDLAGAAADAAQVPDGFMAWVLREEGEDRRNSVAAFQGGAQQAAGFLQGPVRLKTQDVPYGITSLGNNPVTGAPWPDPVPFTGYLDLAIDASTGRAVTDAGYPLTTADPGTVEDTRVQHRIGNTAGGPAPIVNKFTAFADDIPLVNWLEMRLIQAQHANETNNDQAAAIAFVNEVRDAAGLPRVQGAYAAGATQSTVEDMIIEERRRALWLEGRFWSTKIQNPDKLWFPRLQGDWINENATYVLGGAVRVLLPSDEYNINENLSLESRGTGCAAAQAPVFN